MPRGLTPRGSNALRLSTCLTSQWWTLRLIIAASSHIPMHLMALLDKFFAAMSDTRDDFAYRTGGKVA